MNTSALESKITAFKLINMIAESMDKAFAPYAMAILPLMVENINYQYSKAIRKYSLKTIMNILYAIGEPENVNVFKNIFPMYINMI